MARAIARTSPTHRGPSCGRDPVRRSTDRRIRNAGPARAGVRCSWAARHRRVLPESTRARRRRGMARRGTYSPADKPMPTPREPPRACGTVLERHGVPQSLRVAPYPARCWVQKTPSPSAPGLQGRLPTRRDHRLAAPVRGTRVRAAVRPRRDESTPTRPATEGARGSRAAAVSWITFGQRPRGDAAVRSWRRSPRRATTPWPARRGGPRAAD